MGGFDTVLELALLALLTLTLVHAVRLQRALGGLRGDRAALHDAVAGFDGGTRRAEAALTQLQSLSDTLSNQYDRSTALRDDLAYLADRGETLADRLERSVRAARAIETAAPPTPPPSAAPSAASIAPSSAPPAPSWQDAAAGPLRSAAERNLLNALQGRR